MHPRLNYALTILVKVFRAHVQSPVSLHTRTPLVLVSKARLVLALHPLSNCHTVALMSWLPMRNVAIMDFDALAYSMIQSGQ
jgi:hypothetical protein